MTTPAPIPEALPLCRALAEHPARYLFLDQLKVLLDCGEQQDKAQAMARLKGMIDAYSECDLISCRQASSIYNELSDFVWGPLV